MTEQLSFTKPKVPARYCRQCMKRISVVLESRWVWPDGRITDYQSSLGNGFKYSEARHAWTGKYRYRRSPNFCSGICAETFAEVIVKRIDEGRCSPGIGMEWTSRILGRGNEKP
jgi:hypothetical protein